MTETASSPSPDTVRVHVPVSYPLRRIAVAVPRYEVKDAMEELLKSYDGTDEMRQFLFHALWRQKREQSFLELKRTEKTEGENFDIERVLEVLVAENLEKEPGYDKMEQGLMIRILQHLCQDYTLQLHSDSREGREKVFLYELECFIRTKAASVTAAELEEKFHYHRNYYSLILKKYRGKTPKEIREKKK